MKYKVTVMSGYESDFIKYCNEKGIPCKQYPIEALKNRFSVIGNDIGVVDAFPYLYKTESMPMVTLS